MNSAELPLADPAPDPRALAQHSEAQLDAFKQSGVWRHGISFEAAMRDPALRICITTAAEIRIRRQLESQTCAA